MVCRLTPLYVPSGIQRFIRIILTAFLFANDTGRKSLHSPPSCNSLPLRSVPVYMFALHGNNLCCFFPIDRRLYGLLLISTDFFFWSLHFSIVSTCTFLVAFLHCHLSVASAFLL